VAQPQSDQLAPAELVKQVIYNELHPAADSSVHWKYLLQKQVDGKQETRAVVETNSGSLDRLLMIAGRPLTAGEQNAEAERIVQFTRSPEEQRKAEQAREKDAQQANALLQMIPDAFLFEYAGESGSAVKLVFKPNPRFQPSSREGKVLQHMAGEMWVDRDQKRLVSIKGQLIGEVKFGAGLLGHLEKGGRFEVERAEVSRGDWEVTQLVVDMHGKALMFKNICVQQREAHSHFERVSDELTLADAANLLLKQNLIASTQRLQYTSH
jgi:hypothetical protein